MKKFIFLLSVFLISPLMAQAEIVDKIVATVNREPITQYELDEAIQNILKEPVQAPQKENKKNKKGSPAPTASNKPDPSNPELRRAALDHLIDEVILNQQIEKEGVKITDEEINESIGAVMKRNNLTLDALKKELIAKGSSYEKYRKDIAGQLKRIRFIGQIVGNKIQVNEDDVNSFYAQASGKNQDGQEVHIAQIVFPLSDGSSETEAKQMMDKAQGVYKKIKSGANFEQVMKLEGGTGSGDLGRVSFGGISPQVANALGALEEGQVSEPIRTKTAVLIVKMMDKPDGGLKAGDELKDQIRNRIYEIKMQEEIKKYVDQLKTKAFIEIKG
ncbi:MAG: SurA N-terminal domain-containing protein [Deltaproteobacteria bacterium]|nr:SurA N-terminal domain-containing protein [Deltaproteobacteria bacterium]